MAIIDKANDCHVLMKTLCKEMGLTTKITHMQFVETFSKLQSDATKYQGELKDQFRDSVSQELAKQRQEAENEIS